jgi:dolichol kinase
MQRVVERGARVPAPPVWRRLFHIGAGSSIPLAGIYASDTLMVVILSVLSALAVVVEAARFKLPGLNRVLLSRFRPLLKESESGRVTGATYLVIASLVAFLLFDRSVAVAALFFLTLGDPAAALVGSRARGIRVFGKSPWGTMAFIMVALAISGVLSAGGVISFQWAVVAGAAVAAVVELVPTMLDDNLTVPLIGGAAMTLLGA